MTQHLSRHASRWDERRKTAQAQVERRIAFWTKEQSAPIPVQSKDTQVDVEALKARRKSKLELAKRELVNLQANMGKGSKAMNKRARVKKPETV